MNFIIKRMESYISVKNVGRSIRDHYKKNKERYLENLANRREELANWFKEYREKLSCKVCGEARYWVLDFHHKRDKETEVTKMLHSGFSKEKILEEIDKCMVLCSNCHRDLHYQEMQNKQ